MDSENSQKVSANRTQRKSEARRGKCLTQRDKNLDRLARVRENQRKSRARKQEYVRELEQRLAAWKNQVQSKDIEHRLAMQRLEAENRHLRNLLFSLGVSPEIVRQYTLAVDQGTDVGRKVAIPAMQRPMESPSVSSFGGSGTGSPSMVSHTPTDPTEESVVAAQVRASAVSNSGGCALPTQRPAEPQSQTSAPAEPSLCCPAGKATASSFPPDDDVLNTTLCAIAEDLIGQYNTRGVDMDGIRQRLCSGFRSGQSADGCRVQNYLLFQVLDEISNNI